MPFRLYLLPLPLTFALLSGCNTPPDAPTVTIGPMEPRTGDDLMAVVEGAEDKQGAPVTFRYAWKQDGLPRSDLVTDTVPASETTKGEVWEVAVTPSDGELDGEAGRASTTILNTAPDVTVALSPVAPTTDDNVMAVATAIDADEDAVTLSYGWTLDGSPQDDDGTTIAADQTQHGQRWTVTVTPNDGEEDGEAVTADVEIANSVPVVLSVTLVPDAPYVTDDVVAVVESSDADGDAVAYIYTWYVDGTEEQSGENDTLAEGSFEKHQLINVEVVPSDGADEGEAFVSADAEVLNSLPTATGVSIDPEEAYEASILSCVPEGFEDADGDAEGWTYAWAVNGVEVAATDTLDGGSYDKADSVLCSATPWDGEESGSTVTSDALTIANTAPVLASADLSTYAPTQTDTITVTLGTASDDDGDSVSYGYDWYVNGTAVSTSSALLSSHFARADSIYVVVTPWDGSDFGSGVSSAVATGANTPPTVSSISLSPSGVYTDDRLTASVSATDLDGDSLTYTYAWYVDSFPRGSSTSDTLDGESYFDKDQSVYVVVTPNDGSVDGTSGTSSAVTVLNTAPTEPVVEIVPSVAEAGDDLTCSVVTESSDADGDSVTYTFAWEVDGASYAGASDTATESVVDGVDVGAGEEWTCEVEADDGDDTSSVSTAVTVGGVCGDGLVTLTASGIDFVTVCGGTFDMGCTSGQGSWCSTYYPVMPVTLTNDYYVSQTEITQGQYQALMGTNPSYFSSCGTDCPVETVNWHLAAAFANEVSSSAGLTECYTCSGSGLGTSCSVAMDPYGCDGYRLLTEAEWEGAARCGEDLLYAGSDDIDDVAWYSTNSKSRTHTVASKDANACGLFDMSGNVFEWTQDWYVSGYYTSSGRTDPTGASSGTYRLVRGGSWGYSADWAGVISQCIQDPSWGSEYFGFRLARTAP